MGSPRVLKGSRRFVFRHGRDSMKEDNAFLQPNACNMLSPNGMSVQMRRFHERAQGYRGTASIYPRPIPPPLTLPINANTMHKWIQGDSLDSILHGTCLCWRCLSKWSWRWVDGSCSPIPLHPSNERKHFAKTEPRKFLWIEFRMVFAFVGGVGGAGVEFQWLEAAP